MDGHIMSCALPRDIDFYKWVDRLAVVPDNLWLPKIDVKEVVSAFAVDEKLVVYDASPMFNVINGDASKVDNALVLLNERSNNKEDTLHLVCMTAFNVEALVAADIIFQLHDVTQALSDGITVGKYLLHAFCVFKGEFIKMFDVRDATVVRSTLSQFEHEAECMICMNDLHMRPTVLPYACGHPICKSCFEDIDLRECAKCRLRAPWPSQAHLKIDDDVKDAAQANGMIRVRVGKKARKARRAQNAP